MPGFRRGVMRLASLGYAVPGTILAIGFYPAMAVDRWLADLLDVRGLPPDVRRDPAGNLLCHAIPGDCHWRAGFWSGPHSTFAGTGVSRLLGENGAGTFARVHFPLLRPALVSSALLVLLMP